MDQAAAEQKIKDLMKDLQSSLDGAISHLNDEFAKLQVGRAHSGLVENIAIDVYGTQQPLKAVATITIPDPKQIQVQPWDKANLSNIEKGIQVADIGINPVNDGVCIRLNLPPLTEERRKDLVKVVHKLGEESHISIRQSRQNVHNKLKQMHKDKEINEDKMKWEEGNLQKKIDEYNKTVDEHVKAKEEAIMTI